MRRASLIAVACLCCALVAGIAVAPAGGAARSKVTLSIGFNTGQGDPFFKGRVKSKRKSCMSNRLVVMYRSQNGGQVKRFRSDRSDSKGFWRVQMNNRMKTAGYFAVVKPKSGCESDKSKQLGVGQGGDDGLGPGGSGK